MAAPVNNNPPPPPSQDPYTKAYSTGGSSSDPYNTGTDSSGNVPGYDPSMGDPAGSSGSDGMGFDNTIYTSDGSQPMDPTQGSGGGPLTVDGIRSQVTQEQAALDALKTSNPDLWNTIHVEAQKAIDTAKGTVNSAVALSGDAQSAALNNAETSLNSATGMMQGTVDASGKPIDPNAPPGSDKDTVKKQLQDYEKTIDGMQNLSESKKSEYKAQIDQWISGMDLGSVKPEDVTKQFADLQQTISTASLYSPGAQSLAEISGKDPADIDAAAKSHGLDLNNLPNPPTKEVLDFLNDIDPALGDKLKAVEDKVSARNKAVSDTEAACNKQNADNTKDTSDVDNLDMTNFQKQYDLKHHKSQEDKDVTSAMTDARDEIKKDLTALYPDSKIELGKDDGGDDFTSADMLTVDGHTLNLFDYQSGKVNSSPGNKTDATKVNIVTLQVDNEGDGAWGDHGSPDNTINTYGDANAVNYYDT